MEDPWRNPFAESDGPPQPLETPNNSSWDQVHVDIPSSILAEPPTWTPVQDDDVVDWTPTTKGLSPSWEPSETDYGAWGSQGIQGGYHNDNDEVSFHTVHASSPEPDIRVISDEPEVDNDVEPVVLHTPSLEDELPSLSFPKGLTEQTSSPILHAVLHTPDSPELLTPGLPGLSGSPDAFGTFESGFASLEVLPRDNSGSWSPSAASFSQTEPSWGSTWTEPPLLSRREIEGHEETPADEWDQAIAIKQQRDQVVPPNILETWVTRLETLLDEVWVPQQASEAEDNWRMGLEALQNSSQLTDLFLPNLSLTPPAQYSRSMAFKSSITALRVTRTLPITRSSPLSILQASRGSVSWEQSVKLDSKKPSDDWGWVIHKPDPIVEEVEQTKEETKVASAGILSFWGRKTSSISGGEGTETGSHVISRSASPALSVASGSPRPSMDTAPPLATRSRKSSSISSAPTLSIPSVPSSSAVTLEAVSPSLPDIAEVPTPQPPSAVSRFLNRFSRRSASEGNERQTSVSLSATDIAFLGEIVPSVSESEGDDGFDGLDGFLSGPSRPIAPEKTSMRLPEPIAPPPPPSSQIGQRAASFTAPARSSISRTSSTQPPMVIPEENELWDVFGDPPAAIQPMPSSFGLPPPSPQRPSNNGRSITSTTHSPTLSSSINTIRRTVTPVMTPNRASGSSPAPMIPTLFPPPFRSSTPLGRSISTPAASTSAAPAINHHNKQHHNGAPIVPSTKPTPSLPPFPPYDNSRQLPSNSPYAPRRLSKSFQPLASSSSSPNSPPNLSNHSSPYFSPTPAPALADDTFGDFGDFGDFVDSSPVLPTTPSPVMPSAPPPRVPSKPKLRRGHTPTQKLMDEASAHAGQQWPGPPSPPPPSLPPPPLSSHSRSPSSVSITGKPRSGNASLDLNFNFLAAAPVTTPPPLPITKEPRLFPAPPAPLRAISRTNSGAKFPSPPTSSQLTAGTPLTRAITQPPLMPPSRPQASMPARATSTQGGLSAQDLSFFEGL